jgi:hypothetical protein
MPRRTRDIIVLHDAGTTLERSERTKADRAGRREYYKVEISSTPIVHDFSVRKLGKGVTERIKEMIDEDFGKISKTVTPETRERRARALISSEKLVEAKGKAARAKRAPRAKSAKKPAAPKTLGGFIAGAARRVGGPGKKHHESKWYRRRYTGGQTGHTPPKKGATKWLHDSDRMAKSVAVFESADSTSFGVKTVVNRFRRDFWGSHGHDWLGYIQTVRDLIPSLHPTRLGNDPRLRKALDESILQMIQSSRERLRATRAEFWKRLGGMVLRGGSQFLTYSL